jgi:UrcA family protein
MKTSRFARLAGVGMLAVSATIVQASFVNTAFAGVPAGEQAVRIGDLDLNKSADVARLYNRIQAAAESVCAAGPVTGTLLPGNGHLRCVEETIGAAVARMHNEQLSAFHQGKSSASKAAVRPGSAGKDKLSAVARRDRDWFRS